MSEWYPSSDNPVVGRFVEDQARALATTYRVAVLVPGAVSLRSARRMREVGLRVEWPTREFPVVHAIGRSLKPHDPARARRAMHAQARRAWGTITSLVGRPDLIHAHFALQAGIAANDLSTTFGVPVVLTEHASPFAMHLGSAALASMTREALLGSSAVLAVGPGLAEEVTTFEPRTAVRVVPNVVDTEFFRPEEAEGRGSREPHAPLRMAAVSALEHRKGIRHVLEAMTLVGTGPGRRLDLTIVGDGPQRRELESYARSAGISDRCVFLGRVDREGVRSVLVRSDVLVHPSLHESFGVVLAEAGACGIPVIAASSAGARYVVLPETGILVAPGDSAALAAAILTFARGETVFDSSAIRSSVVARFGREAFLRAIDAVYREVLRQPVRSHSMPETPTPSPL